MRAELHAFRHLPTEGLRAERDRLETALRRLGERYQWQELEEADYHRERLQLRPRSTSEPSCATCWSVSKLAWARSLESSSVSKPGPSSRTGQPPW